MIQKKQNDSIETTRALCPPPISRLIGLCLTLIFIFTFLAEDLSRADSVKETEVAILKSKELIPYNLAQEGLQDILGGSESVFTLDDELQRSKEIISDSLRLAPNILCVIGTPAAKIAALTKVPFPIVYSMILNPEIFSEIKGPVAGCIALPSPEDFFETLLSILPDIKKIGTVYDPGQTGFLVQAGQIAARTLDLELTALPAASMKQALKSLEQLSTQVDVIWMLPDRTVMGRQTFEYLLLLSFRHRVPLAAISEKYVNQGALMSLKVDYKHIGQQAGQIAREMLKGNLKENRTSVFAKNNKLIINVKTAKKLGIKIPKPILTNALLVKN